MQNSVSHLDKNEIFVGPFLVLLNTEDKEYNRFILDTLYLNKLSLKSFLLFFFIVHNNFCTS